MQQRTRSDGAQQRSLRLPLHSAYNIALSQGLQFARTSRRQVKSESTVHSRVETYRLVHNISVSRHVKVSLCIQERCLEVSQSVLGSMLQNLHSNAVQANRWLQGSGSSS